MLRLQFYLSILIIFLTIFSKQSSIAVNYKNETCSCKINKANEEQLKVDNGATFYANKYPWLAAVFHEKKRRNYTFLCTASIINSQWLLTHRNCHVVGGYTPTDIAVGVHNTSDHSTLYEVDKYIPHTKYTEYTKSKDGIALIKVRKPIKLSQTIRPICMSLKYLDTIPESLWYAGFGFGEGKLFGPAEPFEYEMNHIDMTRCNSALFGGVNDAAHICARVARKSPRFFNFGGGPLMFLDDFGNIYQVGIKAKGIDAFNKISVFARVSSYLSWIERTIGSSDYCKVYE